MSSMTSNQNNVAINIGLVVFILGFVSLAIFTYLGWQQSTPPNYTKAEAIDKVSHATQLKDHLGQETYGNLRDTVSNVLHEDIGYISIRTDTISEDDNHLSFLADISGASATYRFTIHDEDHDVLVVCPSGSEQRDSAWSCGIAPTGDDHDH